MFCTHHVTLGELLNRKYITFEWRETTSMGIITILNFRFYNNLSRGHFDACINQF